MNFLARIFAYPILMERLADKDAQIVSLKVENQELRDRLFMVRGVPTSGQQTSSHPVVAPYRTGRQRLRDMVEPKINQLSREDEQMIEDSLTQ